MLYLAADHAGFALKEKIKEHLTQKGIPYEDIGAHAFDEADDYPDFAHAAAKRIAQNPSVNKGILLCGSGAGVAIAANKVKGVYCAQVWTPELARLARQHDQVNAIALPARFVDENTARAAVDAFLEDASEEVPERHLRRFRKVRHIEDEAV